MRNPSELADSVVQLENPGHFRAFSFVDRIHSIEGGRRIRGQYSIPAHVEAFPAALVAEAVGQLAAWAAMAAVDFRCRPVAGLAASIELLSDVRPGQTLELEAGLESIDTEASAYDGLASADGIPVIRLQHCVGPMVSLDEFDDPQALRDRFALLQGPGAIPGAFGGIPSLPLKLMDGQPGQSLRAELEVPENAPFFQDHFPRRSVFPGSLLILANLQLVATLAQQWPAPGTGEGWTPRGVSSVKLRAFIPPGRTLSIQTHLVTRSGDTALVKVETRNDSRVVGSARVRLAHEGRA